MNITATLSQDDIKLAIADWLKKQHNAIDVDPKDVIFQIQEGCSDQRESVPSTVTASAIVRKL